MQLASPGWSGLSGCRSDRGLDRVDGQTDLLAEVREGADYGEANQGSGNRVFHGGQTFVFTDKGGDAVHEVFHFFVLLLDAQQVYQQGEAVRIFWLPPLSPVNRTSRQSG